MILKPENLGTIILISAAQRKKTLREEKDKEDAKTVTLLHNQVFLAPQRNRTKSQLHTGGQAAKERSGESTPSPFSGAQGLKAQSPAALKGCCSPRACGAGTHHVCVQCVYNSHQRSPCPQAQPRSGFRLQRVWLYSTEYIPRRTEQKLLEGMGSQRGKARDNEANSLTNPATPLPTAAQ